MLITGNELINITHYCKRVNGDKTNVPLVSFYCLTETETFTVNDYHATLFQLLQHCLLHPSYYIEKNNVSWYLNWKNEFVASVELLRATVVKILVCCTHRPISRAWFRFSSDNLYSGFFNLFSQDDGKLTSNIPAYRSHTL